MKKIILKKKTALRFGVVLGAVFAGFAVLMVFAQRQMLVDTHKQSLQILASEKSAQVNNFLKSQEDKQKILASMNVFKEVVLHPDDPAKTEIAKERINELKEIYPGISLMNSHGIVLVGDIDLPGTDYSQHPYFMAKREDAKFTKYYDPLRKKDYFAMIGPIHSQTNKSEIIGRIAFDIELEKISEIMKESFDYGKNAEVYLIDESGLLLSNSKYVGKSNKHGILIQEIKSEGAKNCLGCLKEHQKDGVIEKHEDEILRYDNYIGDEVYGAHAHIMAVRGCVIAEKSADEITKCFLADYIKNILNK
jgi:Holliday junction resolvase RusA-like endonuclease